MWSKIFLVAAVALSALSCSEGEDSDLQFSFSNSRAILINGTASSCTQISQSGSGSPTKDITARFFSIVGPKLTYTGSGVATIFSIKLTIRSPALQSGTYSCTIASDELGWLFGSGATPWDGTLSPNTLRPVNPACQSLKCGGVDLAQDASIASTATIQIDGMAVENGEETPIRAVETISIEGSF